MAVVIGPQGGTVRAHSERWHANVRERRQWAQAGQQAQAVDARANGWSVGVTSSVSVGGEPYTGSYAVTPTETEQVLATAFTSLRADVVVAAIPANYGKIEWDGVSIHVS